MKITLCSLQITFSGARFLLSFFPTFFLWRKKENYKYAIYSFLLHCITRRSHIEKEAYPCRQGSSCLREQVQFAIRSEEKRKKYPYVPPRKNELHCMAACVFSHNIDEWLPPRKYGKLNLTRDKTDKKQEGLSSPSLFLVFYPYDAIASSFRVEPIEGLLVFIGTHLPLPSFFPSFFWKISLETIPIVPSSLDRRSRNNNIIPLTYRSSWRAFLLTEK